MYRYNDAWREKHPTIRDQWRYNFIAQEYAEVFPQSVREGGETLDGEAVLQMDGSYAQVVAIKALQQLIGENRELVRKQEAQAREIEQLKEEIAALKKVLETLVE